MKTATKVNHLQHLRAAAIVFSEGTLRTREHEHHITVAKEEGREADLVGPTIDGYGAAGLYNQYIQIQAKGDDAVLTFEEREAGLALVWSLWDIDERIAAYLTACDARRDTPEDATENDPIRDDRIWPSDYGISGL